MRGTLHVRTPTGITDRLDYVLYVAGSIDDSVVVNTIQGPKMLRVSITKTTERPKQSIISKTILEIIKD